MLWCVQMGKFNKNCQRNPKRAETHLKSWWSQFTVAVRSSLDEPTVSHSTVRYGAFLFASRGNSRKVHFYILTLVLKDTVCINIYIWRTSPRDMLGWFKEAAVVWTLIKLTELAIRSLNGWLTKGQQSETLSKELRWDVVTGGRIWVNHNMLHTEFIRDVFVWIWACSTACSIIIDKYCLMGIGLAQMRFPAPRCSKTQRKLVKSLLWEVL